uniref:C2H2-type domain-containing protein n=1 Tax=Nothobranchius furzeri TaxID=105023 RepID=A0A8C6LT35_NOTFU
MTQPPPVLACYHIPPGHNKKPAIIHLRRLRHRPKCGTRQLIEYRPILEDLRYCRLHKHHWVFCPLFILPVLTLYTFTAVSIKSEDEEKPLMSHLHELQLDNRGVPTSSSADQMTAGSSRNPDLNHHEQPSGSSETAVSIKSEEDEEKPLFSQLHQQQLEDRDVPTSSSTEQMAAKTDGGAETGMNPDLNLHEQISDSSETEVSGDDEEDDGVNLDSFLLDAGPETGDEDIGWNKSRSSESDVKDVNRPFSCPECGKLFLHKWSLQKHVRLTSHSARRSLGCLVKKKCVTVKQHVDSCRKVQIEIMRVHTGQKPFACELCGKKYNRKTHLSSHMRVHTGQKPFACELCGKKFTHKANSNSHKAVHTGLKPFTCELCGLRFTWKATLSKHMKIHTGLKPFTCELCDLRFTQKTTLNNHMKVHTGLKPFTCELCGLRLTRKTTLNDHMKVHTGLKPFACELCGKKFARKDNLNSHMRVHTGQKPFACELCEKRFSSKTHLNIHMRVHTGQKPFTCEICGQNYRHMETLKSHLRVHTGQKPFACELCGKKFAKKVYLNSHMTVHTGEKPFACVPCGKRFTQKTTLNNHMRVHWETG